MAESNKDLLELEGKNLSSSTIESKLIVCKSNDLSQNQNQKPKPNGKGMPFSSSVPKSQVIGKVKDFLGVISEANERLQDDVVNNAKDYDIEVLTGNESEYIEMDLMLGVADLHTPEAIAAAESAIAGYQAMTSLATSSSSETESEASSNNSSDSDDDDVTCSPSNSKRDMSPVDDSSSIPSRNQKLRKRPKIVELL
ncbi:uncharacterized protein LOC127806550 [Diospyros lotus]|uniref:uncharacterized protein LOC127806550 n=1 Tax=Diospyros lotus TaxID=55363 RepID=UPI002254FDE3|nr:uncharacterized protein LOC127806550 [Diospyros lotus]